MSYLGAWATAFPLTPAALLEADPDVTILGNCSIIRSSSEQASQIDTKGGGEVFRILLLLKSSCLNNNKNSELESDEQVFCSAATIQNIRRLSQCWFLRCNGST